MCALLRKRQEHSQPRYCVEIRCNEHLLDMFCQRKIARQRSGCYMCYCFFQTVLYILQRRSARTQSPIEMYAKNSPGLPRGRGCLLCAPNYRPRPSLGTFEPHLLPQQTPLHHAALNPALAVRAASSRGSSSLPFPASSRAPRP